MQNHLKIRQRLIRLVKCSKLNSTSEGRPKKSLLEIIKELNACDLTRDIALDRAQWQDKQPDLSWWDIQFVIVVQGLIRFLILLHSY